MGEQNSNTLACERSDSSSSASTSNDIFLSIVIPVYNEEESIQPLHERLMDALTPLAKTYEVICVDDGSRDSSFPRLVEMAQEDKAVKVIRFRRNFGQTAAFSAGFDHARGEVIVTMDADLQNDPQDIPKLLEKMDESYEVVSNWRIDRKNPLLAQRLPSRIANTLISD